MTTKEFETEIWEYEKVAVGDRVDLYTLGIPGYRDAEIVEVSKPVFLREIGGFHDGKSSSLYLVTGKVRLLDRAKFELPDYPGGIQLAVQERTTIKEGEQENGN